MSAVMLYFIRPNILEGLAINYAYKIRKLVIINLQKLHTCQQNPEESQDVNAIRRNPLGVQMISAKAHDHIFSGVSSTSDVQDHTASLEFLKKQGLLGSTVKPISYVNLDLPNLQASSLLDHYSLIAKHYGNSYKKLLAKLIKQKLPPMPKYWKLKNGWTRYSPGGTVTSVPYPDCASLVFDTEICVKEGTDPTLACAASNDFWYLWCSDSLIAAKNLNNDVNSIENLIPFGTRHKAERIIVGHHVAFDRTAIKEIYALKKDKTRFMDTMSLHIAVSGLVEEQQLVYKKFSSSKDTNRPAWYAHGCPNNLKDVYSFYCGEELRKEKRDVFVKGSLKEIHDNFQDLAAYCAGDVLATHKVLSKVLPMFLKNCPNPVTLFGMLEMGTTYLPVSSNWHKYLEKAEGEYQKEICKLKEILLELTLENLKYADNDEYKNNLWLWDLDWSLPKKQNKKLHEYPAWYRKLCPTPVTDNVIPLEMSTKLNIIPKLLRLSWKGYPLHYEKGVGWGYLVPTYSLETDVNLLDDKHPLFPYAAFSEFVNSSKSERTGSFKLPTKPVDIGIAHTQFYRLPHKDSGDKNVGDPLGKSYLRYLEDGTMKSTIQHGVQALLKSNRRTSYWKNNRNRIANQIVKWIDTDTSKVTSEPKKLGCILPPVIVAGTITRRAVEKTWMTASNPYADRIGSELKSLVEAPPGYHFVGADVDSQELWIASVLGDSSYGKEHGCTGVGWMTLMGNKAEKTDMHSYTAKVSGISRNEAKILNYGRIYGAGIKFIEKLLREYNSNLSDIECKNKALNLLLRTKGRKAFSLNEYGQSIVSTLKLGNPHEPVNVKMINRIINAADKDGVSVLRSDILTQRSIWTGGSESAMFNKLEDIATVKHPQTPVLGCSITKALRPYVVDKDFMPSRVNWAVQSSAVDFLHLMLTTMQWLIDEYDIDARFSISIHDEVRYLVKSEDRYRAAFALHITNLLTRSYIAIRLGLSDLPESVAFFSAVDIDRILRKEPFDECITPSNPEGMTEGYDIPQGECLDIYQVVEKTNGSLEKNKQP